MGKKGTNFENTLAVDINRATDASVHCWPVKDRVAVDAPDVIVLAPHGVYGLELKNWSDDSSLSDEELQQLLGVENTYVDVAVVINWSRREPVIVEPVWYRLDEYSAVEQFCDGFPEAVDTSVTDSGNLRCYKPDTDVWPSASSGVDGVEKIIERFDLPRA